MKSPEELIVEATGYFELGMFTDSWGLIESLPPEGETGTRVLDIRLRILTALSQWELGEHVASVLFHAGEDERKTVGRFHHARARALWQGGDYSGARTRFRLAVEAWLDVRQEFSDDDLKALFED